MDFLNKYTKYTIPVLDLGVRLPNFKIEDKYLEKYHLDKNINDYHFLFALVLEGLEKKVGRNNEKYKQYYDRAKHELNIFRELGFCSFLLITWDIINYCKENDIPTGFGRGSCAGSIVLYLIDVTQIDSLKYSLFFERFLSKSRAKIKEVNGVKYYQGDLLMDIDCDISFSHRKQVTDWLENKYKGKISKLLTISTLTTKILIKEVTKKYLDYSEEESHEIAGYIPKIFGKVKSIDESIEMSNEFKEFAGKNEEAIRIAKSLSELNSHFGVHPSAWIITESDMGNTFPLQLTKEKEPVTSYSMDDALNLAIKCDILGLRCCSLIDSTCKLVGIKATEINLNDEVIYNNLQRLETPHGLFQIESPVNLRVLKQLKPKNLEHLAAVIACARPGALEFVDDFAKYIEDGSFKSIHPFFDEVLKDCAGAPIYQEHQLKMLNKIGFSLEESEVCRRVLGKKKVEEVKEWSKKIEKKIKENNLPPELIEIVSKVISDSASYSFNFSHAISYASMCAATVYLKFKYPKEFFLCLLNLTKDEPNPIEEVTKIQAEMPFFRIKLLGPHLLKSKKDFQIEGNDIRFSLNSIKSISDKTLEKLQLFCHEYSDKFSIFLSAEQCGIHLNVLNSLIYSGCLDDYLTETRSKTANEANLYSLLTSREKKRTLELGKDFQYNLIEIVKYLSKPQNGNDKSFMNESRMKTLRRDYKKYQEIYKQNSKNEELCRYYFEKLHLGYSYSHKLFDILKKNYNDIIPINEAMTELDNTNVTIGGIVVELKEGRSKNKNKYIKICISDSNAQTNIMLMEKHFEQNNILNNGKKLEEGDIVLVNGRKSNDIIFANRIINQNVKIVTHFSEIPKINT